MLKRLIDLPGMMELERRALMNPRFAEPDARAHYPEIDQCSIALFGLTADQADQVARPAGWDRAEQKPLREQVLALEDEGWDVTDKRRPLRMLGHFNVQLWLALRGVAGRMPPTRDSDDEEAPTAWGSSLEASAKRFKRDRK